MTYKLTANGHPRAIQSGCESLLHPAFDACVQQKRSAIIWELSPGATEWEIKKEFNEFEQAA